MKPKQNCKNNYKVYLHKNKDNGEVFYVGLGRGKRPYCMIRRNPIWHRYVKKYGRPIVIIYMDGLTSLAARDIEKKLINKYKRKKDGGTLTNITKGGEENPMDNPDVRKKYLKSMRSKKMMEVRRKTMLNPEVRKKIRATQATPEYRAKMSAIKKTPEYIKWFKINNPMNKESSRKKISEKLKGRIFSEETKKKMSVAAKTRGLPDALIEVNKIRRQNGWNPMNSQKTRDKMSKIMTGRKCSPEACRKNGIAHSKGVAQITESGDIVKIFKSQRDAANAMGCTASNIGMAVSGRIEKAKGYIWRRVRNGKIITDNINKAGGIAGIVRSEDEVEGLVNQS